MPTLFSSKNCSKYFGFFRGIFFCFLGFSLHHFAWAGNIGSSSGCRELFKPVFAHYMVCCSGIKPPTLESAMEEMEVAQSAGIDGFALNVGGWSSSEPYYKNTSLLFYQAAARLKNKFFLFISVDGKAADEIEDILNSVNLEKAQFRCNGRPVISTFGGERLAGKLIAAAKNHGFFLVPYFYPPTRNEVPSLDEIASMPGLYPEVDGYFYFGAAGDPSQISRVIRQSADSWHRAGKIFVAGLNPYYLGSGHNFRVFESHGFEGLISEFESAINSNSDWIELVTWNDWSESTYFAPLPGHAIQSALWAGHYGDQILSHDGFRRILPYYIAWFKSNIKPKIDCDRIAYAYRLQDRSTKVQRIPGTDQLALPKGGDKLDDYLYITSFMASEGVLSLKIGVNHFEADILGGVSSIRFPIVDGFPELTLTKGGHVVIKKLLELPYSHLENESRLNYFSEIISEKCDEKW